MIVIKCLSTKQEIHFTEELCQKTQSDNEIWPIHVILQEKKLIKKFCKRSGLETSGRSFFISNNKYIPNTNNPL